MEPGNHENDCWQARQGSPDQGFHFRQLEDRCRPPCAEHPGDRAAQPAPRFEKGFRQEQREDHEQDRYQDDLDKDALEGK